MKHLIAGLLSSTLTVPLVAFAAESNENPIGYEVVEEQATPEVNDETYRAEPERVYVASGEGTYRSTRGEEYCFYNEEHDHIRCYDEDPRSRVVVEERTVYRTTRPSRHSRLRSDPIATGLGVGLAIGLPILIHNSIDHRRYRHHYGYRYNNRYNNRYHRYRGNHYDSYHQYGYSKRSHKGKNRKHRGYRY